MRHGKKFCMVCNPNGNGITGEEGSEAVGRYYLQRTSKVDGKMVDHLVCEKCGCECYYFMRAIAPHVGCSVPD